MPLPYDSRQRSVKIGSNPWRLLMPELARFCVHPSRALSGLPSQRRIRWKATVRMHDCDSSPTERARTDSLPGPTTLGIDEGRDSWRACEKWAVYLLLAGASLCANCASVRADLATTGDELLVYDANQTVVDQASSTGR